MTLPVSAPKSSKSAKSRATKDADRPRSERAPRVAFDQRVCIKIEHPGSSVVSFEVQARDLSCTGLRVQHVNFIYPNSPATISFMRGKRVLVTAHGHVVRCDYVGNSRHDVGIMFETPLASSDLVLLTPSNP